MGAKDYLKCVARGQRGLGISAASVLLTVVPGPKPTRLGALAAETFSAFTGNVAPEAASLGNPTTDPEALALARATF